MLGRQQAALYESVVREGLKSVAGESDTFKRQGLVLQMILALKQVCNHPAHYLKQGAADQDESGKAGARRVAWPHHRRGWSSDGSVSRRIGPRASDRRRSHRRCLRASNAR